MLDRLLKFFSDSDDSHPSFIRLTRNILALTLITNVGIIIFVSGIIPDTLQNLTAVRVLSLPLMLEVIALFLAVRGNVSMAKFIVPLGLLAAITYLSLVGLGLHSVSVIAYPVIVVISALLLGPRSRYIFTPLAIVAIEIVAIADITGINQSSFASRTGIEDAVIAGILLLATSEILQLLIKRLSENTRRAQENEQAQRKAIFELRELQAYLEQRVDERTGELAAANAKNERRAAQFEAIAQVSRTISSTQDLDTLLPQITSVISRLFGFYHIGVFLLDAKGEYAVLSAANSEGGQRLLARNHRLKVGEVGIVGYVTSTGNARVALDTGTDAVYFNNSDLPHTRSEIALPFQVGGKVIGALDVQSKEPNAFAEEDVSILSILSEQVGIAIQNAKQHEETRKALAESEMLSRQFIRQGWQQFTKSRNLMGIWHTGAKATLLYTKNGDGNVGNQFNRDDLNTASGEGSLTLPVKLRDEVIGEVKIHNSANRKWDQDEMDIVTAILERAAVSLENARLLNESQKRAAKERTIGEISAKISAQSDIDELLKTAAQELSQTIQNANISIQFKKVETTK
jgi:GAF domain-containing protein